MFSFFKKPKSKLVRLLILLSWASCLLPSTSTAAAIEQTSSLVNDLEKVPLSELQDRRATVKDKLDELANFNLRGGIGTICYRSMPQTDEYSAQWIQIDLDQEYDIDEIALIPAIWRDNENGYRDDGFPLEFKIIVGSDDQDSKEIIADIKTDDSILPRIAPLVIPCQRKGISWIRLEASHLSPRFHDGLYILQFAEIMIFSNSENIALSQKVTVSSEQKSGMRGAYQKENLVDGYLPYLMDAARGQKSNPYLSGFNIGDHPSLVFDIGAPVEITTIRIHTIEQGDTVPHGLQPNFGVPHHLVFEGANQADFSDAEELWEYEPKSLFEIGPIISKRIKSHPLQYYRLRTIKSFEYVGNIDTGVLVEGTRFGFAEIELFSKTKNVARGIDPIPNYETKNHDPNRPLSRLTDGHNIFGEILTFQEWMTQLAKRHNLESALPIINRAIDSKVEQQKKLLRIWSWVAAGLSVLIVFIFLVERILRQRAVYNIREVIAADLHDELGANLHAISLLGDLAIATKATPEKSYKHIDRIRALAARTSAATKHCTNILKTPGLCDDLVEEMKRCSRRITADIDHELNFENEAQIRKLGTRKRINVLLFYKECLVNIIRHSGATQAKTQLTATKKQLTLIVNDNGYGLSKTSDVPVPPSLKRRARFIGGKVALTDLNSNGSQITLKVRI